jgi:hypothetical protein
LVAPAILTPGQEQAAARVDALDLDPVVFALMHPYPGLTVMGLAEADQVVTAYRCWLKLCAWYPEEPLVPSLSIDDAWRAHLADTAKYARDCQAAFGGFAHCYPHGRDSRQAAGHAPTGGPATCSACTSEPTCLGPPPAAGNPTPAPSAAMAGPAASSSSATRQARREAPSRSLTASAPGPSAAGLPPRPAAGRSPTSRAVRLARREPRRHR